MKFKNLQMPKNVEVDDKTATTTYAKFTMEPLERGFGVTLGNALRRVLLSSLPGAAVTAAKIDGVQHEFSTITGVKEDVPEILMNLKMMRFKIHSDGPKMATFEARGAGNLTAKELKADPDIEVLNPELHIATLNKDGEFRCEIEIGAGRGYVSAENQATQDRPIGVLPMDAMFSPVTKVNFEVENTRIGQRIDYDKLTLEIWTDGSVIPSDALAYAAKILKDHFSIFIHFEEEIVEEVEEEVDEEFMRIKTLLERSVEELELSVRSSNCLKAANIKTIGDLVTKSEGEMLKYRNFGRKSLKEIADILTGMNLGFGMDVSKYKLGEKIEAA
ncbi:MAG TPA: DNA-directed RNA polymerase subunit alpha [Candidatus Eisenbacteria bacterium]|nr:DNA-directed RNA polymerase subunit alpha [Candidatus Eisenbacteria bacterium]HEU4333571.1 DNA-directed RNA polymerase subunit alpha [Candidatus Eisenbacteria bacterium]